MSRPACSLLAMSRAGALALVVAGCGMEPTYRREQVAGAIQQELAGEAFRTSVHVLDHTLAIHVIADDTMDQSGQELGVGPQFDAVAHALLSAVHRVLLSSDEQIRFYVVLIADPEFPDAAWTIVRYLDDIKRANVNMISTPEMFSRTIFDLNLVGPGPLDLAEYIPRDIELEDFLSWQLARRIQARLAQELQDTAAAEVGRCSGEFLDSEFAFQLNVSSGRTAFDAALVDRLFETAAEVVAQVLSEYGFDRFRGVRLTHPATGRHLVLPKANLELFRSPNPTG